MPLFGRNIFLFTIRFLDFFEEYILQSGAVVACMVHTHEVTGSNPVSAPIRNVYQSSNHVVKMNFEIFRFVI